MQKFCAACHPAKADAAASQGLELFTSMDENKPRK
jgi:hypothetical protein